MTVTGSIDPARLLEEQLAYLGLDALARVQALGTTTEEVTAEQPLQAITA